MGCVPSLPHPCSLKEEARFTFVYIIGRGSDVYIYLMCLIDRVLGVYLSAVVLLCLRGRRDDEHLFTLLYFPWNAQHIIDREPKI